MAKTTAPLLSFGGNGQIGKTQVYASWRGVKYARRYTVPSNPNTTDQQQTRTTFSWLVASWKVMNSNVQATWTAFAKGRQFTDRNAWISQNLPGLSGPTGTPATDIDMIVASPGSNAGLAPAGLVLSDGGTQHIVATLTAPTLPSGWTITKQHAVAWKQQDAHVDTDYNSYYAFDASAPYAASIAAPAAGTYVCSSYFEFVKADGTTAFGPSMTDTVVIA